MDVYCTYPADDNSTWAGVLAPVGVWHGTIYLPHWWVIAARMPDLLVSWSVAGEGNVATVQTIDPHTQSCRNGGPLVPFLLGAAVGASAGAVAGTLMSRYGVHLIAAMMGALDRRGSRDDRDKLRFDLLLQ